MISTASHSSLFFTRYLCFRAKIVRSRCRSCVCRPARGQGFSRLVMGRRRLSVTVRIWESAGDHLEEVAGAHLEEEILEFMQRSPTPDRFPTKKELIAAGRTDLVERIAMAGGWLALGWDSDDGDGGSWDSEDGNEGNARSSEPTLDQEGRRFAAGAATSSVRPAETVEEETGLDGILIRLKKERDASFALESKNVGDDRRGMSLNATVAGSETSDHSLSLEAGKDLYIEPGVADFANGNSPGCSRENSQNSPMWRVWSSQRAGYQETEFEAVQIASLNNGIGSLKDQFTPGVVPLGDNVVSESSQKEVEDQETFQKQIQSRLQGLEAELLSVLNMLRSNTVAVVSHKGERKLSDELEELSDAWEFQETEIMKTRDILRSTRAKLAVLEGKTSLQIIEVQKLIEEKRKRIDSAQKALRLLRTAFIVWPNPATEVLLAGSFDGWTSQRRMERSSSGIFSLHLKLYPGQYEIKFIVDGAWMVDPLRPIVHNGHENNLLIIS